MKYYYSKTTDSFYPEEYKAQYVSNNSWPADAVLVSYEDFSKFSLSVNPSGKKRHFKDGVFEWVEDILTITQLVFSERLWRDCELVRCDFEVYKVQDSDPNAQGSVGGWREYRKALRAWPEHQDFPKTEFRPKAPDFKE